MSARARIRDAITGRFTTRQDAEARPSETVTEHDDNDAAIALSYLYKAAMQHGMPYDHPAVERARNILFPK